MRLGLEEKISQIMGDTNKVKLLSKRDLNSLMKFMRNKQIYSVSIMEYIYIKSGYEDGIFILRGSFLCTVCKNDNLEAFKFLSSEGIVRRFPRIKSGAIWNSALIITCEKGYIDFLKFLLSSEVAERFPEIDPSKYYDDLLFKASYYDHIEIVKFLLSDDIMMKFPSIDSGKLYGVVITWMVSKNKIDIIKILLEDRKVKNVELSGAINMARIQRRTGIKNLLMSVKN